MWFNAHKSNLSMDIKIQKYEMNGNINISNYFIKLILWQFFYLQITIMDLFIEFRDFVFAHNYEICLILLHLKF